MTALVLPIQTPTVFDHTPRVAVRPAVQARALTKWFGVGDARTLAVREVSFEARWRNAVHRRAFG